MMLLLWLASALAQPFIDLTIEDVSPGISQELGCRARVTQLTTVRELDGVSGWALARCPLGRLRLVVIDDTPDRGASTAPMRGRPQVHGFLDIYRHTRHLQEVGKTMRLSAGPHRHERTALIVTSSWPRRMYIFDLVRRGARVMLDVRLTPKTDVEIAQDPTCFRVTTRDEPLVVPF